MVDERGCAETVGTDGHEADTSRAENVKEPSINFIMGVDELLEALGPEIDDVEEGKDTNFVVLCASLRGRSTILSCCVQGVAVSLHQSPTTLDDLGHHQ